MSRSGRRVLCFLHAMLLVCTLRAQTPKRPTSSSSSTGAGSAAIDPGTSTSGVYRNAAFGFSYKLKFGWVDRTREMSDASDDTSKAMVLLAAFEHPPEVKGDTVNSAVVIAVEAASRYPGLQNAEHYFGPLTELTKSKDFTVVNPPYDFSVGTKLLMRGDFSKDLGKLTMRQSTMVMMEKGFVVSFTFIGGTEDEVDELVERLSFGAKHPPAPHK